MRARRVEHMEESQPTTVGQFLRELQDRTRVADLCLLTLVPAVLVGVYLTPASLRQSYLFEYTDPDLVSAFVSNLIHLDWLHLVVNLGMYVLVVSLVYVLDTLNGRRDRFYLVFGVFLGVLPVVLSYLNLAAVRPAVGFGFSGVVMAFVGYLPVALAEFIDRRLGIGSRRLLAPVLVFPSLALIAVLSLWSVIPENPTVVVVVLGVVATVALVTGSYAVSLYQGRRLELRTRLSDAASLGGYWEVTVVSIALVFAVPFVAFPTDPHQFNGTVNLYIHLLGYALGFLVTYSYAEVETRYPIGAAQTGG